MARFGAALVIGLALAMAGAGCAGHGVGPEPGMRSGAGPASASPRIEPAWTSCAAAGGSTADLGGDSVPLPRLDPVFHAVAAVLCRSTPRRRPDGGTDLVATESRARDVTALVAALRLPDLPAATVACTLEGYVAPFLALLDEKGRWVRPGYPVDGCGHPRTEYVAALQRLQFTQVSSRPIRQIESAGAVAAGCEQQWADMVWVTGADGVPSRPAASPALYEGTAPVRICVYRVPTAEQGTGKPAGDFLSGRPLTGAQWATVRREVLAASPAAACTTPATRFTLVRTAAGEIYVELDGCRRVLASTTAGHDTLLRGSTILAAALAG